MGDLRVDWMEYATPGHLPVAQVSGFCFDSSGRILLIEDAGVFGLPGGQPEQHESYEATLKREAREEAQVILGDVKLLGYQRVEGDMSLLGGAPYAQIRMVARLAQVLRSAPDPATGLTYRRFLCLPAAVPGLLRWKAFGDAQVAVACRLAQQVWALDGCFCAMTASDDCRVL